MNESLTRKAIENNFKELFRLRVLIPWLFQYLVNSAYSTLPLSLIGEQSIFVEAITHLSNLFLHLGHILAWQLVLELLHLGLGVEEHGLGLIDGLQPPAIDLWFGLVSHVDHGSAWTWRLSFVGEEQSTFEPSEMDQGPRPIA